MAASPSRSSAFFPTSARDCNRGGECGPEPSVVFLGAVTHESNVILSDSSGNTVGDVIIPNSVAPGGTLSVTVLSGIDGVEFDNVILGNSVIDVTLLDVFSNPVTQLVDPIEICVAENRDVDVSLLHVNHIVCNSFLNPGYDMFGFL